MAGMEAQDAEVVRRSLVRDQGGEIGEQNRYWRPPSTGGRYRSKRRRARGGWAVADGVACNSINAPAGDFLTHGSSGVHWKRTYGISRNCRPASCAQAPSRPEGHARTTRVGGAKRRALHGAEHSSKLECVTATDHADAGQPFADEPDDR